MSYRLKVTENLLSEKSHLVTGQSIKKQKQNKQNPPKTNQYQGVLKIRNIFLDSADPIQYIRHCAKNTSWATHTQF